MKKLTKLKSFFKLSGKGSPIRKFGRLFFREPVAGLWSFCFQKDVDSKRLTAISGDQTESKQGSSPAMNAIRWMGSLNHAEDRHLRPCRRQGPPGPGLLCRVLHCMGFDLLKKLILTWKADRECLPWMGATPTLPPARTTSLSDQGCYAKYWMGLISVNSKNPPYLGSRQKGWRATPTMPAARTTSTFQRGCHAMPCQARPGHRS